MKKIALLLVATLLTFSCSNEPMALNAESATITNSAASAKTAATTKSPSTSSTSNWGDYNIKVSVSDDGSEWTYLITKAKDNAKTLSHFIIDLNNCGDKSATLADVVWAKVNGSYTKLLNTEGNGTSCEPTSNNFIKFPTFSTADSWTLVIKFDRGYGKYEDAKAWIKAGSSCNEGTVTALGCPKEEYCSFSQGYFFANGADNNGSSAIWGTGVTIGGIKYSQEQGMYFWSIDKGQGGDQTMNAFFQLGAVRLSGVESQVAAYAAIIDAYFNGIDAEDVSKTIKTGYKGKNTFLYFDLPESVTTTNAVITKTMVINAGSAIGTYIYTHHCPKDTYTEN